MNLKISENLLNRLKNHLKETSFKSIDELVEYILENYITENMGQSVKEESSTPDEINKRLKDLGYL